MANKMDQDRKNAGRDAAEVAVNGYLGGVGSHPSLKGLRLVTPSLFGLGAVAAILFDIDEYADAKNIQDFTIQGVGTAGGIGGAYAGGVIGVSVGIYFGPVGAVLGGAFGSALGAILGEDAFESAARDVFAGYDALGEYLSTFSTFDAIQTNRPGQYLSGWKDGAPSYSGTKYSGGINDYGTSWGLDSPSERTGPSERGQFTAPQASVGAGGIAPSTLPLAVNPVNTTTPLVFAPISPVTPPNFAPVPMSPVAAPSFPSPESQTTSRAAALGKDRVTGNIGTGGFGERGGFGGGYGQAGTSVGNGAQGGGGTRGGYNGGGFGSTGGSNPGSGSSGGFTGRVGGNVNGVNGWAGGTGGKGTPGSIEGIMLDTITIDSRTGTVTSGNSGGGARGGNAGSTGGRGSSGTNDGRGDGTSGRAGWSGRPVLLDLDGHGIELSTLNESGYFVDIDGSGLKHRSAWAGSGTGVLVFDADCDGKISQSKEFAFVEWAPTANSDFEALRQVFDTNGNGKLDAGDAQWASFRVAVGDQLVTLDSLGITSIDLIPSGSGQTFADGSAITGTSTYTKADGTTAAVGDAVLVVDAKGYRIDESTATLPNGASLTTIRGYHPSGQQAFVNEVTISADGLTRSTQFDDDGDGIFDRSQQIVQSIASDGTRTKTVADFAADGSLLIKTTTITSADGKAVTTTLDSDGDGLPDQRQIFERQTDGSSTTTTEELSVSGNLLKKVEVTASADGLTRTTYLDANGTGTYHVVIEELTAVKADGSKTRTESRYSADHTLISRTTTVISGDGRAQTISYDRDGDGVIDAREITSVMMDANGDVRTDILSLNGDGSESGLANTTLSLNGKTRESRVDLTGDGIADLVTKEVVSTDGSIWTETIESRSSDGTLLSQKHTVIDSVNETKIITTDTDGDGTVNVEETTVTDRDGSATTIIQIRNRDGSLRESSTLSVTESGLWRHLASDLDGDGNNDIINTDDIVSDQDGSRTRKVRELSRNGGLIHQIITETSSDGLTVTSWEDVTGDRVADLTTTDSLVLNPDGSRTQTITVASLNGNLLAKTVTWQGSDRKSSTTAIDENGDGHTDRVLEETKNVDGGIRTVETEKNANGTLRSKTVSEVSADRLSTMIETDVDGDGTVDLRSVDATTLSVDGSRTTVESNYAGTTLVSQKTIHISGNGFNTATAFDQNGDGVIERNVIDSLLINDDGTRIHTKAVKSGNSHDIISQTVTTTSSNGLNTTFSVDQDGDGQAERVTRSVKSLNANGSISETVTVISANGETIFKSQADTSADSNTVNVTTDQDGDGQADLTSVTMEQSNGTVSETVSTFDNSAGTTKLASRSIKVVGSNGFVTRVEHDTDGDGLVDYVDNATLCINDDGSRLEEIWRENASGSLIEKTLVNKSANGLQQSIAWQGMEGASRGSVTKETTINADGSTVQTEQFKKANGSLQSLTRTTVTADKMQTVVTRDIDGNSRIDHRTDIQRQIDGSLVSTYTDYDNDGVTVTARKAVTRSASGNNVRVDYDSYGNGQFETREETQIATSSNGDVTTITSRMDGALTLLNRVKVKESANGSIIESKWDFNGDGYDDQRRLDVTTLSSTGSTTRTISDFDANNELTRRIEQTASANGLALTVGWDFDGSGSFEQESQDIAVINADGTTTRTITTSKNGSIFSNTVSTTSADGSKQTIFEEFGGLGLASRNLLVENKIRADGANSDSLMVYDSSGTIAESRTTVTSADKRSAETMSDIDGDGKTDQTKTYVRYNDGSQSSVTTGYRNGNIKTYQMTRTVSSDGLAVNTEWDEDGNGSVDRRREVINQFNIDGSSKSTTTDHASSGAILSSALETISADGLKRNVSRDLNGDGVVDVTEASQTRIDGQIVTTIMNNNEGQKAQYISPGSVYWQASVAARIERTVSGDGLAWTERSDYDGNGTYEHVVTSLRQIDGSVISLIAEYNADGSVKASGSLIETADGRTRILTKDTGHDGTVDEIQTSVSKLDGSFLWAKKEFSTSGNLVQTTHEIFNSMGKLSSRISEDALGRKTGEFVFDVSGSSVYYVYDVATGSLLSETSMDKNGIKLTASLHDPLNGESWAKITQTYVDGKLSTQNKINDDGTGEKITYSQEMPSIIEFSDPLNIKDWLTIKQTYTSGKITTQERVNDDGTTEITRYNASNGLINIVEMADSNNVHAWKTIRQIFENGKLSSYDLRWDDGARDYFVYNPTTQKVAYQTYYYANGSIREKLSFDRSTGNLSTQVLYEIDGRLKEKTTIESFGERTTIWYDTANQQSWKTLEQVSGMNGELTKQEMVRDDNTKETWFFDPQNTQSWSSVVWQGDSNWRMTSKITYYDDGSREAVFWDPANSQSWSEFIQRFNTGTQLKSQEQSNDDGTKEYWWWDVDNESSTGGAYVGWNHIYEKRNQSGQVIKKAIQWDPGYWTYPVPPILLDLNGDGEIELNPLNQNALQSSSGTTFDWDGDGVADQTAWVGPNDGILVIDLASDGTAGADGKIDQAREIAFSLWKTEDERQAELVEQGIDETGRMVTDLEGLRFAFDTNGDNILDSRDNRWSEFRVWQDINQNGIADDGELLTMEDAGIKLINLLPSSDGAKAFADGSAITGTSTAEKTDGSSMLVADATFSYRSSAAA